MKYPENQEAGRDEVEALLDGELDKAKLELHHAQMDERKAVALRQALELKCKLLAAAVSAVDSVEDG